MMDLIRRPEVRHGLPFSMGIEYCISRGAALPEHLIADQEVFFLGRLPVLMKRLFDMQLLLDLFQ
jgi:hypothetical protein